MLKTPKASSNVANVEMLPITNANVANSLSQGTGEQVGNWNWQHWQHWQHSRKGAYLPRAAAAIDGGLPPSPADEWRRVPQGN